MFIFKNEFVRFGLLMAFIGFAIVFFRPENSTAIYDGSSTGSYHVGYDYEEITVGTVTALGVTVGKIDTTYPDSTRIYVEADVDMNCRWDGQADPSATLGHKIAAGERLQVEGLINIQQVKFISINAGSATAKVTFERKQLLREGF